MECVAHYSYQEKDYHELKPLSMNQYERLLEAKRIRMESSTENQHLDQCHTIPINGFDETKHGIYLEPCYKKFTGIIAPYKRKNPEPLAVRPKKSKVDEALSRPGFFSKICFFCKAWKRYFNRKRTVHTRSPPLMQ